MPDNVSVVRFDDLEEAKFASPPAYNGTAATLRQQGKRATEMLLALMAGEAVLECVTLPTELLIVNRADASLKMNT